MQKTPEKFDLRNDKAKEIESHAIPIDVKVGEFRRYYEGINIGNEISKDGLFLRPCMVIKNTLGNGLVCVLPITSKYHDRLKRYYITINNSEKYGFTKDSNLIINQMKYIDSRRLQSPVGDQKASKEFVGYVRKICSNFLL